MESANPPTKQKTVSLRFVPLMPIAMLFQVLPENVFVEDMKLNIFPMLPFFIIFNMD